MPDRTVPMIQNSETYSPVSMTAGRRKQALTVWSLTLALVGLWIIAIVAAPVGKYAGLDGLAFPLYKFFSYICHQIPSRSFHVLGGQFGVCSRCFGVYFGLLIGIVVYPLWRGVDNIHAVPRFWLFLSLVPISIDWLLTALGIWENTQLSRLVTGAVLGFACATFIMPAIVEIIRNFNSAPAKARP